MIIQILQFLLSLSLLVILHEFGHYITARIFKVRVEKFYIFFNLGFSLFKKKVGDTEYGIGWLPLGGYVKLSGMIDESMDTKQMKESPKPWEFRSKPAWQRLIIMLAGIIMNIITAFLIYITIITTWGTNYLPSSQVKQIYADSLGQQIGLRTGDRIISVNGKEVERFKDIFVNLILEEPHSLQVLREKDTINIVLTDKDLAQVIEHGPFFTPRFPFVVAGFVDTSQSVAYKAGIQKGDMIIAIADNPIEFFDKAPTILQNYKNQEVDVHVLRDNDTLIFTVKLSESGMLGVIAETDLSKFYDIRTKHYSFWQAIPEGIKLTFNQIDSYLKQFKLIFNPETKAYKSVGTFITIGNLFPKQWDWQFFWSITAFLSIVLAIINLLPIPGFDGGHALFAIWEIITGRKPGDKFIEYAQMVGMFILLMLFILALWNDFTRFIFK